MTKEKTNKIILLIILAIVCLIGAILLSINWSAINWQREYDQKYDAIYEEEYEKIYTQKKNENSQPITLSYADRSRLFSYSFEGLDIPRNNAHNKYSFTFCNHYNSAINLSIKIEFKNLDSDNYVTKTDDYTLTPGDNTFTISAGDVLGHIGNTVIYDNTQYRSIKSVSFQANGVSSEYITMLTDHSYRLQYSTQKEDLDASIRSSIDTKKINEELSKSLSPKPNNSARLLLSVPLYIFALAFTFAIILMRLDQKFPIPDETQKTDPKTTNASTTETNDSHRTTKSTKVICAYCGNRYSEDLDNCPKCGANKIKK